MSLREHIMHLTQLHYMSRDMTGSLSEKLDYETQEARVKEKDKQDAKWDNSIEQRRNTAELKARQNIPIAFYKSLQLEAHKLTMHPFINDQRERDILRMSSQGIVNDFLSTTCSVFSSSEKPLDWLRAEHDRAESLIKELPYKYCKQLD